MDAHSMLLEHTLVMAGETVDCGSVWQGWPTRSQITLLKHRSTSHQQLSILNKLYLTEMKTFSVLDDNNIHDDDDDDNGDDENAKQKSKSIRNESQPLLNKTFRV